MHTPSPRIRCPRCGANYDDEQRYCGQCGCSMQIESVSQRLVATTQLREVSDGTPDTSGKYEQNWDDDSSASTGMAFDRRVVASRDQWLGQLIDSRYKVIEVIGRGGMGVVYKVKHQRMGKFAAMKVLHHELAHDAEVLGRFRREAEAVSRLTHPNTVQVFDFGTASGALYLIMEYVRGPDLATLIKRDGPLPFSRAAPLFAQICGALEEAHELGVIHRDLKPDNILVTRTHGGRDFVKVLDFGLAKLREREEIPSVTERGSIVGTPYFMSPEQIRGEEVDERSDIYSLGALMYKVLTGEYVYTAKTPVGVLTKHLTTKLVRPSERRPDLQIDPRIDDLISIALRKRREERFPAIAGLLAELEATFIECGAGSGIRALDGLSLSSTFGSGRAVGSAVPPNDEIDYGIDAGARLKRADLDEYEKSLRRWRWLGVATVPAVAAIGIGLTAYFLWWRGEQPRTWEDEPNNDINFPTLITTDSKVGGQIGKRLGERRSDRDYFKVTPTPPPGSLVTVHVTALPNIDIELTLLDIDGNILAYRNEHSAGQDEWIRNQAVTSQVIVKVNEAMPQGPRLPTENVSDNYALSVRYISKTSGVEQEPNETVAQATALRPEAGANGYLDKADDIDMFRFEGSDGQYELQLAGTNGALSWQVGNNEPRRETSAIVTLKRGDILTLKRQETDFTPGGAPAWVDAPYSLTLARK